MVLTILEARVAPERAADLRAAFAAAGARSTPPGLLRSDLLQSAAEPGVWRIQTLWESRETLQAMRRAGTPEGVLMFRAAGAEATLSIFEVAATITPAAS
jgi:heme-degrading monooxygenase HmoA